MNSLEALLKLAGRWPGTYRLWLAPATAPSESQSVASVAGIAQNKFVQMDYDWAFQDEAQEGSLLLGGE